MLSWQRQEIPFAAKVFGIAECADGALWACGSLGEKSGAASGVILQRRSNKTLGKTLGKTWEVAGRFPGHPLRNLHIGVSGTVCAVGERVLLRSLNQPAATGEEPQWQLQPLYEADRYSVWGHTPDDVYVLSSRSLWHHDGRELRQVDLEGQGISGRWAQGDGSPDGENWLVGTYATHSCMATGNGPRWQQRGCASWYLYRVKVGGRGRAWAAGGDGFYVLCDGEWRREPRYEPKGGWLPLGIHVFPGAESGQERIYHLSTPMFEFMEAGSLRSVTVTGSGAGASKRHSHPAPCTGIVSVFLLSSGELLAVTESGALWESAPLQL